VYVFFTLPFLANIPVKALLLILAKFSSTCALAFLIPSPCVWSIVTSVRNMKRLPPALLSIVGPHTGKDFCLPELLREVYLLCTSLLGRGKATSA